MSPRTLLLPLIVSLLPQACLALEPDIPRRSGVLRDEINGIQSTDLALMSEEAQSPWIIAEIALDPRKDGPALNSKNETVLHRVGTCKVAHTLTGKVDLPQWDFAWDQPAVLIGPRKFPPITNGVFLLRVNLSATGPGQFASTTRLETLEMGEKLHEALEYYRAHREMFSSDNVSKNREGLEELATGKNPFLALAAFGQLLPEGLVDAKYIRSILAEFHGAARGCAFRKLLLSCSSEQVERMSQSLTQLVDDATTISDVEPLVTEAFFFEKSSKPAIQVASRSVKAIEGRLATLKGSDEERSAVLKLIQLFQSNHP